MTYPVSVIVKPVNSVRVNPRHPEGMRGYNRAHVLYVMDAARVMWVIDAPRLIPGWSLGVSVLTYTHRGGNMHHLRVRGLVYCGSGVVVGDVPDVPAPLWRYVSVHS